MIEIRVAAIINSKIDEAYNLLKNYEGYKNWWAIPTETLPDIDNYFQFSPLPFVKIGLEEDVCQPNKMLRFNYVKGPFRGAGIWELEAIDDARTKVSYTIKLKPVNKIIALLANTAVFKWKHSLDIKNIIQKIENQSTCH